jgi:hypothetical protein
MGKSKRVEGHKSPHTVSGPTDYLCLAKVHTTDDQKANFPWSQHLNICPYNIKCGSFIPLTQNHFSASPPSAMMHLSHLGTSLTTLLW